MLLDHSKFLNGKIHKNYSLFFKGELNFQKCLFVKIKKIISISSHINLFCLISVNYLYFTNFLN